MSQCLRGSQMEADRSDVRENRSRQYGFTTQGSQFPLLSGVSCVDRAQPPLLRSHGPVFSPLQGNGSTASWLTCLHPRCPCSCGPIRFQRGQHHPLSPCSGEGEEPRARKRGRGERGKAGAGEQTEELSEEEWRGFAGQKKGERGQRSEGPLRRPCVLRPVPPPRTRVLCHTG